MKSGLIVYNIDDKEKNQWFIDKCLQELNRDGFSLSYLDEDDVLNYIKEHKVDFVIYRGRDYQFLQQLENKGIRTFNNSLTNKIANDKYETYRMLESMNIPNIPTFLDLSKVNTFPCIMKSVSGHGGSEVFLINNIAEQRAILERNPKISFIYQDFIKNEGDVRLYVLNGEVVAAVKRNNANDYRNNFSLGGEATKYNAPLQMKEAAIKIAQTINATHVGIDFLLTKDGYRVIEIEDPVGSRMLYKVSDIDIISLYCRVIREKI